MNYHYLAFGYWHEEKKYETYSSCAVLTQAPEYLKWNEESSDAVTTFVEVFNKVEDAMAVNTRPIFKFTAELTGGKLTTSNDHRLIHSAISYEVTFRSGDYNDGQEVTFRGISPSKDDAHHRVHKLYANFLNTFINKKGEWQ